MSRGPATGLESMIAVHDSTLGPSLGGIRMRSYRDLDAAIADAPDLVHLDRRDEEPKLISTCVTWAGAAGETAATRGATT